MNKVSVIIPIYKVEKYLRKCLESVVSQTYKNLEVILVDDESPDGCGQICEEYATRYSYIKVIHQKNQGLSGARNSGTRIATGDYVTYIDSDDFVTENYVEYLLHLIQQYDADVSVGRYVYQYENKPLKDIRQDEYSICLSPAEALSKMNYGKGAGIVAWCKMYKRELVLKHPYPVGKIYEDLATTYKIVGDSKKIAFGTLPIYYWIQRDGSIMNSSFSVKQFDGLEAAKQQLEYVQMYFPTIVKAAKYRYVAKGAELMSICLKTGGDIGVYKKLKAWMNPYSFVVLFDNNAKISMKLRVLGMMLGYFPAKLVFNIHERLKQRIS